MQKTKALNWLFPENVRRVEKQSTKVGRFLLGYMLKNFQRGPWSLSTPCVCQLPSSWPCHGWDSSHWLPAGAAVGFMGKDRIIKKSFNPSPASHEIRPLKKMPEACLCETLRLSLRGSEVRLFSECYMVRRESYIMKSNGILLIFSNQGNV